MSSECGLGSWREACCVLGAGAEFVVVLMGCFKAMLAAVNVASAVRCWSSFWKVLMVMLMLARQAEAAEAAVLVLMSSRVLGCLRVLGLGLTQPHNSLRHRPLVDTSNIQGYHKT